MLICWRYHQSWIRALQQNLELWREILQPFSAATHTSRKYFGQKFAENSTNNPFWALQLKPSHHHQAEGPQYEVILTFHWLFGFNTEKKEENVSQLLFLYVYVFRVEEKSTEKKFKVNREKVWSGFWYWKCFLSFPFICSTPTLGWSWKVQAAQRHLSTVTVSGCISNSCWDIFFHRQEIATCTCEKLTNFFPHDYAVKFC